METGGEGRPDPLAVRRALENDFRIIMRFWDCPKVTIAAVHRYCLGSAMELALACDLTIAADDCVFGAPEVRFGSGIVAMLLPWLAGPKRAKQLLLTGEDRLPAAQALQMGLVSQRGAGGTADGRGTGAGRRIAAQRPPRSHAHQAGDQPQPGRGRMRQALLQALELDVIIETTETAESREFNAIPKRDGRKGRDRLAERTDGTTDIEKTTEQADDRRAGRAARILERHPATQNLELLQPDMLGVLRGKRVVRAEFAKPFKDGVNFQA